MYAEDRVLVAVMSRPSDLEVARSEGWYRIPASHAPRGVFFEYVAFYLTAAFGEEKWTVPYYARCLGHELVTRRDLLPDEGDHPRADEPYYKLQLGPLQGRERPIASRRWRRVTFIHTTWDRFQAAREINDLFAEGGEFVDRLYHALREEGFAPERRYPVREAGAEYIVDLAVPCRQGVLAVEVTDSTPDFGRALHLRLDQIDTDLAGCLATIRTEVRRRGGELLQPDDLDEEEAGR
jgi:hypothetical protein